MDALALGGLTGTGLLLAGIWRSPDWIKPKECAHLALAVILELQAKGFQIVKKAT
jgi:hypothetical protein